jgi:hypothetical protein
MSNLVDHARREFAVLGWLDGDEMQSLMCKQVIELLTLFSSHGHSGFSANYAANLFNDLVRFKPLGPLTGADSEWCEVSDGLWQNKRCSHVFKENGQAYDIEAVIFREPDGACFTSKDSHKNIEFPYTPERTYVDVPKSE